MIYCAFELLFAEAVDLDLELDVGAVENELLHRDSHRNALIADWHVESHLLYIIEHTDPLFHIR